VISCEVDGGRFNLRVIGVCVHDGYVLLHRSDRDDFWSLPGGRGEFMEPSAETIRRELREELGCDVRVERLLWVAETFFGAGAHRFHEIGLYYQVEIPDRADLLDKAAVQRGVEGPDLGLVFRWFPLGQVGRLRLYPTFLRDELRALPSTIRHVVSWEAGEEAEDIRAVPETDARMACGEESVCTSEDVEAGSDA
jgi:ADP-ribose pyrophosphatase YjhB (NUDIX family)